LQTACGKQFRAPVTLPTESRGKARICITAPSSAWAVLWARGKRIAAAERRFAPPASPDPSENTMSDIAIRKQNENKPAVPGERTWDPWHTMRSLLAWDPFREMAAFPTLEQNTFSVAPAFDVKETKDAYEFKADVPGIQEKDLEVSMTGNRLTVSGKRESQKEEKGDRFYTLERSYGSFTRSFSLPDGADTDKVHAALEKGVLSINVPKRPEVQAKKIAVKSEAQSQKS
jgi:HSP20 family protein